MHLLFSISENVRDKLGYKELKSKCDLQSHIDEWSFSRGFSKHIFDSCESQPVICLSWKTIVFSGHLCPDRPFWHVQIILKNILFLGRFKYLKFRIERACVEWSVWSCFIWTVIDLTTSTQTPSFKHCVSGYWSLHIIKWHPVARSCQLLKFSYCGLFN